jgi:hypothetical protein
VANHVLERNLAPYDALSGEIDMFGNLFGKSKPNISKSAEATVRFVRAVQWELGDRRGAVLPVALARNPRFIGALLGIIDFSYSQFGDSISEGKIAAQVMETLFEGNSHVAMAIVHNGSEIDGVIEELEKTFEFLQWVFSLPRAEQEQHYLFLNKWI